MSAAASSGLARWAPADQCAVRRQSAPSACAGWRQRVAPIALRRRCAVPVPPATETRGQCLRRLPVFERAVAAVAAVDHTLPCDRSIIDSNFHGQVDLALLLAKRESVQARARQETLRGRRGSAHRADLPRRQRAVDLRGDFLVHHADRSALRRRRIALVDDKLITGATALEASVSLIRAGAAAVPRLTGAHNE